MPAPLSNTLYVPSRRCRKSCCQANFALSSTVKFDLLPPSRQITAPVVLLILYAPHVCRDETRTFPSAASPTELAWKKSYGRCASLPCGSGAYDSSGPMCLLACHSKTFLPVAISISWITQSCSTPSFEPPSGVRSYGIGS